jgi:predicted RNase H-like HicB family nuclease
MSRRLTAIVQAEGTGFVSLCPELDIASQGDSIEEARDNLREAVRTFGWLVRYRRLLVDHERLPETSEAKILAAMTHLMLRRLEPGE